MPVAVNLSFGNTYGAHNGTSLLERFLDNVSEIGRSVICVGSGNEGASGGHVGGSVAVTGHRSGRTEAARQRDSQPFLDSMRRGPPASSVNLTVVSPRI